MGEDMRIFSEAFGDDKSGNTIKYNRIKKKIPVVA